MLKAAILTMSAALGIVPPVQQRQAPPTGEVRVLIPEGTTMRCELAGGCYVANEAGLDALVHEVIEQTAAACRKGQSL